MHIRRAVYEDLPEILSIYAQARAFMASYGNGGQWGTNKPAPEILEEDIRLERLYVCVTDAGDMEADSHTVADSCADIKAGDAQDSSAAGQIALVFMLLEGKDPHYSLIVDGSWPDDKPYKTIHRVASTRKVKGSADFVFSWFEEQCRKDGCNFRGDTHEKNLPMQRVFERNGLVRCGTVFMNDGSPRYGYQKTLIHE